MKSMHHRGKRSPAIGLSALCLLVLLSLAACGTPAIGPQQTATPAQTALPTDIVPTATTKPTLPEPTFTKVPTLAEPTPTMASPCDVLPPGLVYWTATGFWQTVNDGQSVQLTAQTNAVISPDGTRALFVEENDIWLADLTTGERRNLTQTPDLSETHPRWWPQRPDLVVFIARRLEGHEKPPVAQGFLALVGVDGSRYRVLDDQTLIGGAAGLPAPSPDGQAIAYGDDNAAWLFRWSTGPEVFAPRDYGLDDADGDLRMANPAWSPDGKQLSWVVHRDRQFGIAVFDLEQHTAWVGHFYDPVGMDGFPPATVWSPDGSWLAVVAMASNIQEMGMWVLQADQLETEHYLGRGSEPLWSPDGRWLAFAGSSDDGQWQPWIADTQTWNLCPLALPLDAYLAGWIGGESEPPPTPTVPPATLVPSGVDWQTYSSASYAVSLRHPATWLPVPGYDERIGGEDGFFALNAMGGDVMSIDEVTRLEAEHKLQPYGSDPTIESLEIAGQEARLILPSADHPWGAMPQAGLIVRYPQPVDISGNTYQFFVLWADPDHIRDIAESLEFILD